MCTTPLPFLLLGIYCFVLSLSACSHVRDRDSGSRVKIVEGVDISESEFPAVVKITLKDDTGGYLGICTGEFISAATLLTAAHCLEDGANAFLEIEGRIVPSSKTFVNPRYQPFDPESTRFDLALLRFENYMHPVHMQISRLRPELGAEVTLLGYGKSSFTTTPGAGIGIKRQGRAKIQQISAGKLQLFYSPNSGDAAAAPGDSGGALLLSSGTLAGITSVGAPESNGAIVNQYVDLTSSESSSFFREAAAAGWILPVLGEP